MPSNCPFTLRKRSVILWLPDPSLDEVTTLTFPGFRKKAGSAAPYFLQELKRKMRNKICKLNFISVTLLPVWFNCPDQENKPLTFPRCRKQFPECGSHLQFRPVSSSLN